MDFDLDAIDSRFAHYPLSFGYVVLAQQFADKLTLEWRAIGSCKAQFKQLICNPLIAFPLTSHRVCRTQTTCFTNQIWICFN